MQSSILEQAKQGNIKAIATLINRQTQVRGVLATAALRDRVLLVRLEAEQLPDQQMVQVVQRSIIPLGTVHFQQVRVFGRQSGSQSDAWTQELVLETASSTQPVAGASLEERAQQGDELAIVTLINRALNTPTITAKARVRQNQLQLVLESEDVPDSSACLAVVQQALERANVKLTTQVYGRKVGETMPAWSHALQLQLAPSRSVKEQAKQGNVEAIATLLNQAIAHKDATTTVSLNDRNLRVMVQSAQVPDQKAIPLLIQRTIIGLRSEAIAAIEVYGQQTGDEFPAWSQTIALENRSLQVATSLPTSSPPSISLPSPPPPMSLTSSIPGDSWSRLSVEKKILVAIGAVLPIPLLGVLTFFLIFRLFGVLFSIFIALIPAKIAADKGYNFHVWYFYGLFLSFSAVIHATLLEPVQSSSTLNTASDPLSLMPASESSAPVANRDLIGKDFQNQDLQGADFRNAILTGANFRQANLTGANFSHARIGGACFDHANLNEATFSQARTEIQDDWIKLMTGVLPFWGWLAVGVITFVLLLIPYVQTMLLGALAVVITVVALLLVIGIQEPVVLSGAGAIVVASLLFLIVLVPILSPWRGMMREPIGLYALFGMVAVVAPAIAMSRSLKARNWAGFGTWFGALFGWLAIWFVPARMIRGFGILPQNMIPFLFQDGLASIRNTIGITLLLLLVCCAIAGRATARVVSLRMTSFQDANLTRADLSEANLRRANFRRAKLTEANLTNTDLTHAIGLNGQAYVRRR